MSIAFVPSTRREHFVPPQNMDPTLRAAIAAAVAGMGHPTVLHFHRRQVDGANEYQLLPMLERRPQPGEVLSVGDQVLGTVAGVCLWWTATPDGGRVEVVVVEVG